MKRENTSLVFIVCLHFTWDGVSCRLDLTAPAGRSPGTVRMGGGQSRSTWSIPCLRYVLPHAVKKTRVPASVVVLGSAGEHKKGGKDLWFSVCKREKIIKLFGGSCLPPPSPLFLRDLYPVSLQDTMNLLH